jgi:ubiquinone/menaquinone biosynthesis C-methylase UbiE
MAGPGNIYYNIFMMPFEKLVLHRMRKNLVTKARGKVLEVGYGTGVNLKYYTFDKIDSLVMIDRDAKPSYRKHIRTGVKVLEADVTKLPFEDKSFDTVVFTLVFCSVDDPKAGFAEIRRVLKDDGTIVFIEHVIPKSKTGRRFANGINKTWNSFSKGCNLNRRTVETIKESGFTVCDYIRKGVFAGGTAKK